MRDLVPYFIDVVKILTAVDLSAEAVEGPQIEERDNHYGYLSVALRYADGSTLHVALWADCSADPIEWPHYSFHYQDRAGGLRFRWDNSRYHPHVETFPDHLRNGVTTPGALRGIVAGRNRSLSGVVQRASRSGRCTTAARRRTHAGQDRRGPITAHAGGRAARYGIEALCRADAASCPAAHVVVQLRRAHRPPTA